MKIEVSNGEILDKLTILHLKLAFISDKKKLVNVRKEADELNPIATDMFQEYGKDLRELYEELAEINHKLWYIEDWIRDLEKEESFGQDFIDLARSVYITNDKRSEVKKKINILTDSELIEEKSYE
jgi:predicted nuclease with TOPRIM domain